MNSNTVLKWVQLPVVLIPVLGVYYLIKAKIVMQCLAVRIQNGDSAAEAELYLNYRTSLQKYFRHHLGMDNWEDAFQNTMLDVIIQLRAGKLQKSESLTAYIQAIARNHKTQKVKKLISSRTHFLELSTGDHVSDCKTDPELASIQRQEMRYASKVLSGLTWLEQQLLLGFYTQNENSEQLQKRLKLTSTSFRLRKCRAKKKLACLVMLRLSKTHLRFVAD